MRIGNIIKDPTGSLWVVTDINDRTVKAVAFDAENMSATMRLDDHTRNDACPCEGTDEECATCGGTGSYEREIVGWKHSTVLGDNVKAFILKGVRRSFGF